MPGRPTIVRPLDTPRLDAAKRGVATQMGQVLNRAGAQCNWQLLAALYAVVGALSGLGRLAYRGAIARLFAQMRTYAGVESWCSRAGGGPPIGAGRRVIPDAGWSSKRAGAGRFGVGDRGIVTAPRTRRGRDSKARIVAAAAGLMYERGVTATSVEDVLKASGAGKSQFYHYFASREELVAEVLRHQLAVVLEEQGRFRLDTWDGIREWLHAMVLAQEARRRFLGCPLGSLAGEVLEQGDLLRRTAADAFVRWEGVLAEGLGALKSQGLLRRDVDLQALAESTIATLQGGYLLSSAKRDIAAMRNAAGAALRLLDSYAAEAPLPTRRERPG
jgi:TetR/AcrR family transcriptional repressor of nem operon